MARRKKDQARLCVEARFKGEHAWTWMLGPGEKLRAGPDGRAELRVAPELLSEPLTLVEVKERADFCLQLPEGARYHEGRDDGDAYREPAWHIAQGERLDFERGHAVEVDLGPWALHLCRVEQVERISRVRPWRGGHWPLGALIAALLLHGVLATLALAAPERTTRLPEAKAIAPECECEWLCMRTRPATYGTCEGRYEAKRGRCRIVRGGRAKFALHKTCSPVLAHLLEGNGAKQRLAGY